MQRQWAVFAAFGSAVYFLGLYLAMRVPALERTAQEAREEKSDPLRVFLRIGSLFADRVPQEAYARELGGWEWLPRLIVLVTCFFLIYHAARRSTTLGRTAALGAGALVLAAGVGDVTGIAIAVVHSGNALPVEMTLLREFWSSDAIFFGVFSVPFVALYPFAALMLNRRFGSPERHSGRLPAMLATAGVVPLVALAFLGGAQQGHFPTGPAKGVARLLEEIGAYVLYVRLRPTPPRDPDWGYDEVLPLKDWLPQTIFALVFITIVWLVLRWVVRDRTTWLMVWTAVVFASVVAGCVDAVSAHLYDPELNGNLVTTLVDRLPKAVRYGTLFGWLPAVAVVVFSRLNRTSPRTPHPTPADTAPDSSARPTGKPSDSPRD